MFFAKRLLLQYEKNAGVQWAWANSTLRQLKDQEEMDLVHHYLGTVVYKYVKKLTIWHMDKKTICLRNI